MYMYIQHSLPTGDCVLRLGSTPCCVSLLLLLLLLLLPLLRPLSLFFFLSFRVLHGRQHCRLTLEGSSNSYACYRLATFCVFGRLTAVLASVSVTVRATCYHYMSLLSAANSSAPGPRHLLYLTASFVCSKFFCCSSAVRE
jgi:hypothetical protein